MSVLDPTVDAAFRAYSQDRKFSNVTLARWSCLAPADAAAVNTLMHELRLGENQLRDLWDWAEDIAVRDGVSIEQVLRSDPVTAARGREVGRNEKLKLIKLALKRLRYPTLTSSEDRLASLLRALQLPRSVRVILPEHLEGDEIRFEVVARDVVGLRQAAVQLLSATESPACDALFRALTETP